MHDAIQFQWASACHFGWNEPFGVTQIRARICRPFKEPRNLFPAWRASTTTLFVVPASQATKAGGIDSSESNPELHKRLQIRAQLKISNNCQKIRSRTQLRSRATSYTTAHPYICSKIHNGGPAPVCDNLCKFLYRNTENNGEKEADLR